MATADILALTGVQPLLGRFYGPDDDKPGAARTVVLSYGLWKRRFGGEASIVGKSIQLSGDSYAVIGVLPQELRFLSAVDLFVPLGLFADRYQERGSHPGLYYYSIASFTAVMGRGAVLWDRTLGGKEDSSRASAAGSVAGGVGPSGVSI
jgi:MacB-like periplasmic core domain